MKTIKVKTWKEVPKNYTGKVEYEDGDIDYLLNRQPHRLDGPARIWCFDLKEFWINKKFICSSRNENYEQIFYNSKEYKLAKQQEDLLNNMKLIKNIT